MMRILLIVSQRVNKHRYKNKKTNPEIQTKFIRINLVSLYEAPFKTKRFAILQQNSNDY